LLLLYSVNIKNPNKLVTKIVMTTTDMILLYLEL
jgi:hypothetical protein